MQPLIVHLKHSNESIKHTAGREPVPSILFRLFRAQAAAALAISIVGITANMSAEGLQYPDIEIKVGMILYVVLFGQMILYVIILAIRRRSIEKGEHRALLAVALSSPLILVRLLYVFFVWFLHDSTFSMLDGNVTVLLFMSVLEEIVVVIICLAVGLTLQVRDERGIHSELRPMINDDAQDVKP